MKYAIEIIGYGRRQRYAIKSVSSSGLISPVNYKVYKDQETATKAARDLGIEISAIGDVYKILAAVK